MSLVAVCVSLRHLLSGPMLTPDHSNGNDSGFMRVDEHSAWISYRLAYSIHQALQAHW